MSHFSVAKILQVEQYILISLLSFNDFFHLVDLFLKLLDSFLSFRFIVAVVLEFNQIIIKQSFDFFQMPNPSLRLSHWVNSIIVINLVLNTLNLLGGSSRELLAASLTAYQYSSQWEYHVR